MFLVNNFQYLGPFWSYRGCGNHQGLVSHQQCHYWDLHVTCTLSSTSTMEGKLVLLCACLLQLYAGCLHQCCEGILLSDCLTGWWPGSSRTWRLCLWHSTQDARGAAEQQHVWEERDLCQSEQWQKGYFKTCLHTWLQACATPGCQ